MVPDATCPRLTHRTIVRYSWRPMPNTHAICALRAAASRTRPVAVATIITTTGTIGAGVRARVQD